MTTPEAGSDALPPASAPAAQTWRERALKLVDEGRFPEARDACLAMLRVWVGNRGPEFFGALIMTVIAHGRFGQFGAALGFLEEASRLAVTEQQRYQCLKLTGNCQHGGDDYESALAIYQKAWQLAVRLGDEERQAAILNNIGVV